MSDGTVEDFLLWQSFPQQENNISPLPNLHQIANLQASSSSKSTEATTTQENILSTCFRDVDTVTGRVGRLRNIESYTLSSEKQLILTNINEYIGQRQVISSEPAFALC